MISFIIPTVNRAQTLARCVNSILRQVSREDEVIIVHQGREMGESLVSHDSPSIKVMDLPEVGLSKARNAGARSAQNQIIAFVDDDMVLDENYVTNVKRHMQGNIAAICGRILTPNSHMPYVKVHDDRFVLIDQSIFKLKRCLGGNMVFRRKEFWGVGGFDDAFGAGAHYGGAEDIDVVLRLLYKKVVVIYAPDVIGFHPPEAKDNLEKYVAKVYRYGRGEGAVYAKHWLRYGRWLMLINFLGTILKPAISVAFALFQTNPQRLMMYRHIIKGRLSGFLEYRKSFYEN